MKELNVKSDFKRYRQAAGITQPEASELFGFTTSFVVRKYDLCQKEIPDASWLSFLKVSKKNIQATLEDIEEDIRETEKRLFGEC